jgi:hypothetical protein
MPRWSDSKSGLFYTLHFSSLWFQYNYVIRLKDWILLKSMGRVMSDDASFIICHKQTQSNKVTNFHLCFHKFYFWIWPFFQFWQENFTSNFKQFLQSTVLIIWSTISTWVQNFLWSSQSYTSDNFLLQL